MKGVQQLLSLILVLMLFIPEIIAMESQEKMDLSTESIIDTSITLCLLYSLVNNQKLISKLGTLDNESTLNPFLACPVRRDGLECLCRNGYFKNPRSLKVHLRALTGDYRCLECKSLCSGKKTLKNHTCSSLLKKEQKITTQLQFKVV